MVHLKHQPPDSCFMIGPYSMTFMAYDIYIDEKSWGFRFCLLVGLMVAFVLLLKNC